MEVNIMGVDIIMVNKEQITEIYNGYSKSLLEVNRTYQRKLVWTLEEKQNLIDTIMHKYPIPLFIFATHRIVDDNNKSIIKREIIDGLQRIDAIISFINNEFPVSIDGEEGYFNLTSSPITIPMLNSGKLKQKEPVLDVDLCSEFALYFLATTTIEADSVSVEDVFKRINATGRQLSPQELRQAGVISKFSSMVQQLASHLRGDYTKENVVLLEDMQKYSLSNGELHYGVDIRNVFWTKQGIINYDALRRSKDEEIITHICNFILTDYKAGISKKTLDNLYNENSGVFQKNEKLLTDEYQMLLSGGILSVFEDIKKALNCERKTFKSLITVNEKSRNMDLVFILVFLAIYKLESNGYYFSDFKLFAKTLRNIADEELSELIRTQDVKWDCNERIRLIERIANRIKKCMDFRNIDSEADKELRELLVRAVAEEQMYDFKMGITTLENGSFNVKLIEKCLQTLIAMANTKPYNKGYVVIGIANDKESSDAFEKHYGKRVAKYGNLFVTGVESEANKYYRNMDCYLRKITDTICSFENKVSLEIIHNILTDIHIMPYGDDSLIVLSLQATEVPLFYDNKLFVRYQSNNKELKPGSPEFNNVLRSFNNNNNNT